MWNFKVFFLLVVTAAGANAVPAAVKPNQDERTPITLDEILNGAFGARGISASWAPGQDNSLRMNDGNLVVEYDMDDADNTRKVVLDRAKIGMTYSGWSLSPDDKYVLLEHDRQSLWRYSALAKYTIFEVASNKLVPLQPVESPEQPILRLVKWSPNGKGIAFVDFDYNIHYVKNIGEYMLDNSFEDNIKQLTTDGSEENAIYNGISDWVYEEEMFGGPTAMWISDSGEYLAFVKFDDSEVPMFQWPMYGDAGGESSYPEYRQIRYPKAGVKNPNAEMYVVSLTTEAAAEKLNYQTAEADDIIGTAVWTPKNELLLIILNREQTTADWSLCTVSSNSCEKMHQYRPNNGAGWVDINTPKVSKTGDEFLYIASVEQSPGVSYKHIVKVLRNMTVQPVTTGHLSVDGISGWDQDAGKIYFSGTYSNGTYSDPNQGHVYVISDSGDSQSLSCLTCGLKNNVGQDCKENTASFSAQFKKYIHRCGGPDIPEIIARTTSMSLPVASPGATAENNAALREALSKKLVPIIKEYEVPVGDFTARARLYFPTNMDPNKKYPLFISVYGGPGSQNLRQNWGLSWETSLVSNRNVIFGYIDGRGTARQTTEHLFTVHNKLGVLEIQDQITVAKYLMSQEANIDKENTAIWGWSYGGYATARVLEMDTDGVYKCGISVAPVTSWRYYDTIYTERYMNTPRENEVGYNNSDVNLHVENLKNKQFMLVHGNADDNVHYQQSMVLARTLEQNDIFFHQLSYPDENHGINGQGMRRHLYHSLERFLFEECFHTDVDEEPTNAPPTNTNAPPTNTNAPPTNTNAPPTNTNAPPTNTNAPPTNIPPEITPTTTDTSGGGTLTWSVVTFALTFLLARI